MKISAVRHTWPEKAGFFIDRPNGYQEYTFLRFYNSVEITQNGQVVRTRPNAVILYAPGTPQNFISPTPLTHDWMHFSGDISHLLAESNLKSDTIYYPSNVNFVTEIIYEMEAEFYGTRFRKETLLSLKFQELFLKLGRAVTHEDIPTIPLETRRKFHILRGKVFSDLQRNWTVADMADAVSLSQSRFYTIYRSLYGISPNLDLIQAKINSAENMLSFSNMKIEDIAFELGYRNTTHFIRQFNKFKGLSPSQYRKQARDI